MKKVTVHAQRPAVPRPRTSTNGRRRGLASVLAMLYLILISTLAIGFFVATTLSAQIAKNERGLSRAQAAADGGMQFVRYQLGAVTIAPTVSTDQYLTTVAQQLNTLIGGTANMNGNAVTVTNGAIYIPSQNGWTWVDKSVGTQFRATIVQSGANLVVSCVGSGSGISVGRTIQVQFQKAPKAGAILNYGVASKGSVTTGGASYIQGATDPTKGSVLSADTSNPTPIIIGGKAVSGDLSVVNPSATISVASGSSVGGTSDPVQILTHEHKGVPAPTFPWIDTSAFAKYATNTYVAGSTTYTNIVIPPNTNPSFAGGTVINGVMLIEPPNVVRFKGNATINGVIVEDTSSPNYGTFNSTSNQVNFGGSVASTPVSSLDPSVYGGLTKLTGSFMLVPDFAVSLTGNFGTVGGSIAAGQVSMTGNATGTVIGSVIGMQDVPMTVNGSADIIISSTGTSNYPTGINFGNNFTPLPGTYLEVTQ